MAQWYLDHYGRTGVTQGIILETDGHPQYGFNGAGNQAGTNIAYTCKAAANAAAAAKADTTNSPDGIRIFTVGYGVTSGTYCPTYTTNMTADDGTYNMYEGADNTGFNWSHQPATTLLRTIATSPSDYYENPASATLASVFADAARKLAKGGSHLVQLCPAPIVNSYNPATWIANPVGLGTSITIAGQNFTGATSVTFGGVAATSFSVGADASITATTRGATAGATVTTPCGTN